jgi:hypothetical protein
MTPRVGKVEYVEKIRDGGSLALRFQSEGGFDFILFTKLLSANTGTAAHENLGFGQPVLIDCNPEENALDTEENCYSELSGPSMQISWNEARQIVKRASKILIDLQSWQTEWFRALEHVVETEGGLPPTYDRFPVPRKPID